MDPFKLQDLSQRLFGREADLSALRARAAKPGLTAVTGTAQIGKSFVLRQLAWQCAQQAPPSDYIVGFSRSPQGAHDPLLQVVNDLYQRWLSQASGLEQLRESWNQQKDGLLPSLAQFAGDLFSKTSKLVPGIGDLISGALNGLVAINNDLRTPLTLSTLQFPQARDLISSVCSISKRRVMLVLDQWEETPDTEPQVNQFKDYLREISDSDSMHGCHIFVGVRDGRQAELLNSLPGESPYAALHPLAEMIMSTPAEEQRMISYLRERVPGVKSEPDKAVLNLIGGYPRVIYRLTADDALETVQTFEGCSQIQKDSMKFRYRDLETLLDAIDQDQQRLTIRLLLAPITESAAAWAVLKPIIIADLQPRLLDDLKKRNVLVRGSETPTFGNAMRREAARAFLKWSETMKAEAASLAIALARPITEVSQDKVYYAAALRDLQQTIRKEDLPPLPLALVWAAAVFLGRPAVPLQDLLAGVTEAGKSQEPGVGPLLAIAVIGLMEQDSNRQDPKIAELLLEGLRYLARNYPGNQTVRETLCAGLATALTDASKRFNFPMRNTRLQELHDQIALSPPTEKMQESLALALYNTLESLCLLREEKTPADLSRRDNLLVEIRGIALANPNSPALRMYLSAGISETLFFAKAEHNYANREELIKELRELAAAHANEPWLREQLARGLFITVRDFLLDKDWDNAEQALKELEKLAESHPGEAAIQDQRKYALYFKLFRAPHKAISRTP